MVMNLSYRKKTIKEVIHTLNTMEDGETLKIGMQITTDDNYEELL